MLRHLISLEKFLRGWHQDRGLSTCIKFELQSNNEIGSQYTQSALGRLDVRNIVDSFLQNFTKLGMTSLSLQTSQIIRLEMSIIE